MKQMLKRLSACVLTAVLLMSMTVIGYAADMAEVYISGDSEITAGATATFTVSIQNNPGIAGFVLAYTVTDSNGKDVSSSFTHAGNWLTATGILKDEEGETIGTLTRDGAIYVNWNTNADVTGDGALLTMKLTAAQDIFNGNYTLTLSLRDADPGNFANVSGKVDVTFRPFTFTVIGGENVTAETPTINTQPAAASAYTVGGTAEALTVEASVTDGGALSYQWYSNTTNSAEGGTEIAGATAASYTPSTDVTGTTYYYCVVTNTLAGAVPGTAVSSVAQVTVTDLPVQDVTWTSTLTTNATYGDPAITGNTAEASGAITYTSSDPKVATVDATTGEVTITGVGTVTITATAEAVPGQFTEGVNTYTLVVSPRNASNAAVTLETDKYDYTGKEIKPAVTEVKLGDAVLTEGTDYTVTYSANTGVGEATVTVTFQGNYTGSANASFEIKAAAPTVNVTTSVSSGTIRVTVTTFDGGSAITGYTVILKDGEEIVETQEITEDGTVTFTGLTNGKTYTVEVTVTNDVDSTTETVTATPKASSSGGSGGGSVSATKPVTAEDAENGAVTVSPANAAPGASVTVTPTPDDGYTVDQVTVTDANGNSVEVTDNGDGTFTFVMPSTAVTVAATFKEDEAEHDCPSEKFTDFVASAWYHEAVDYVVVNGYFVGTTETTFEPETPMTRAMFVQVLANMSGADLSKYTSSSFTDVDTGAWYAPAVEWAYRSGIVDGVGDGLFAPGQEITREQMAKMLRDYAAFVGANVSNTDEAGLSAFADSADVSDWAVEAVAWAVNNGIINGTDKGLEPLNNATRAEVAQILMNFDQ